MTKNNFVERIPVFVNGVEVTQYDGWRSTPQDSEPRTLTVIGWASRVLENSDRPLHYVTIFDEMVKLGYQPSGYSPLNTLRARLAEANQSSVNVIRRTAKGVYGIE